MIETAAGAGGLTPLQAILYGGGLVGVFDFLYATLRTLSQGGAWYRPWQGVASALLGPDAMSGGVLVVLLGIVCHFIVALCIVTAYVLVSRSVPLLTRHAVPLGLLYGAFVFWFMSWIVVSLTRIGHPLKFSTQGFWMSLAVHILLVGLPAALFARRVVWAGR